MEEQHQKICELRRQTVTRKCKDTATQFQITSLRLRLTVADLRICQNSSTAVQRIQSMASLQEVPELGEDTYENISNDLGKLHQQLILIHSQLEKVVIQTKEAENRLHQLNKVEKIVRRYNNIS